MFFILLISSLDVYIIGARYIKYLVPIFCLIYWIQSSEWCIKLTPATTPFSVLIIASLPLLIFSNAYGAFDLYFYLTALAPFLFATGLRINPERAFVYTSIVYVIVILPKFLSQGFYYSFSSSSSVFEQSTFAFVFGLYSVYFLHTKNFKYFAISLILSILVLKRISILAIFLISVINFFPKKYLVLLLRPWLMVGLNVFSVFIVFLITTAWFDGFSRETFGMNASQLTQGRNVLYQAMHELQHNGLLGLLFGNGLGVTYSLAADTIGHDSKVNIHSDILKIYLESGLVILCIFIYLLYKSSRVIFPLVLYINIIFLTDNISTYVLVMFTFYFLSQDLIIRNEIEVKATTAISTRDSKTGLFHMPISRH